jgi:hypothetical protein
LANLKNAAEYNGVTVNDISDYLMKAYAEPSGAAAGLQKEMI